MCLDGPVAILHALIMQQRLGKWLKNSVTSSLGLSDNHPTKVGKRAKRKAEKAIRSS